MSRLIDADEVVKTLLCTPDVEEIFLDLAQKRRLDYLHNVEESDVIDFARDIVKAVIGVIKTSPTVDAVPMVHGHWITVEPSDEYSYCEVICSACGMRGGKHMTMYCPHCGAKMGGERKEK